MPPGRRRFGRPLGERRYRKLFVLAMEGVKSEPKYFAMFNDQNSVIRVSCLKGKHSDPLRVLDRMKNHLKKVGLKKSDEAWLVVDKDQWTDSQLSQLHDWTRKSDNYRFALSNPKFEYWLLLHFEDGKGVTSSERCSQKLRQHLPAYDKGIDVRKITPDMILRAINRAKQRDNPACTDWPRTTGTTVYKLVENILNSQTQPYPPS